MDLLLKTGSFIAANVEDKMDKEQAEKNFRFWKKLVNLPDHFPKLAPLKDNEISELMVIRPEVEREIINSLFSKQLTQVVVSEGNGLSAIFQYVFKKCQNEASDKLTIPVSINLEEITEEEISWEFLERQIKKQVLGNLISNPWNDVLAEEHYYYCINYQEDRDYNTYRADMLDFMFGKKKKAWRTFCSSFPFLKEKLDKFLNYLLENLRIKTILFFHIPRHNKNGKNINEERILELISSLKIIHEKNSFKPAAISEIYFINQSKKADLNREYKRAYNSINYPEMTAAEIFSMLNKRFRPSLPGPMGRVDRIDLGAVFAEEFVKLCWPGKGGINEVIDKIQKMILDQMACERNQVPYKLVPTEGQLSKKNVQGVVAEKPRRFVREKN
jgi:hypothetical protein